MLSYNFPFSLGESENSQRIFFVLLIYILPTLVRETKLNKTTLYGSVRNEVWRTHFDIHAVSSSRFRFYSDYEGE